MGDNKLKLVREDQWFIDEETGELFHKWKDLDAHAFENARTAKVRKLILTGAHEAIIIWAGIRRIKDDGNPKVNEVYEERERKAKEVFAEERDRLHLLKESDLEKPEIYQWGTQARRYFIGWILKLIFEHELGESHGAQALYIEFLKLDHERKRSKGIKETD